MLFLFYEDRNYTFLVSCLPQYKDKKKRQETVQKTELFVQNLRPPVHQRLRIEL
jgi:hypothetical protein